MAVPLDWLRLSGLDIRGRAAVTVGLVALLLVAGVVARAVRRWYDDESGSSRILTVGLVLGLLGLAAAIAALLLSLWGDVPPVRTALSAFDVANPVTVAMQVVATGAVVVGVYLLTGLTDRFVYEYTQDRTAITQHQRELIYRSTQVSAYVLAGLVLFSVWGVNLGGLLVGAGFLGIVVGLAARQTLGSLIAGFVLMFARPFEIGDWVQVGDREGIVTEISIVNTRIQTFDGEFAMIPNDTVSANEVINRTRKGRLRIEVEVGVDYTTDVDEAMEVAVAAMREVDEVLAVPQPRAVLKGFDASAVTIGLRFWIDKPSARRKWRAQTAVITAVKSAFEEAGIKIPFPQRELMGREETGGFRMEGPPPGAVEPRVERDATAADETGDG